MADDFDPQRVFERFSTAYDKPRRRQRRRLSLFPWTPMQQAASTSSVTADTTSVTADSTSHTADES